MYPTCPEPRDGSSMLVRKCLWDEDWLEICEGREGVWGKMWDEDS